MSEPYEREAGIWMQQFAAIEDRQHALPDPAVIWLKARVLQSAKEVQRAARPVTIAQIGAYAAIATCWTVLLTWKWSAIHAWLTAIQPSHIVLGAATAGQTAPITIPFLATLLLLGAATVALAMHTILSEE